MHVYKKLHWYIYFFFFHLYIDVILCLFLEPNKEIMIDCPPQVSNFRMSPRQGRLTTEGVISTLPSMYKNNKQLFYKDKTN